MFPPMRPSPTNPSFALLVAISGTSCDRRRQSSVTRHDRVDWRARSMTALASVTLCVSAPGAPAVLALGREKIDRVGGGGGNQQAFLFDLDGTLIDSVYHHVIAWRDALESVGIDLPVWKIHRRIGMSGGLFVNALARELDRDLAPRLVAELPRLHGEAYIARFGSVRPL